VIHSDLVGRLLQLMGAKRRACYFIGDGVVSFQNRYDFSIHSVTMVLAWIGSTFGWAYTSFYFFSCFAAVLANSRV
jgi:hypothetical protein